MVEASAALDTPIQPDETGLPPSIVLLRRGLSAADKFAQHGGAAAQGFAQAAEPFRRKSTPQQDGAPTTPRRGHADTAGDV